MASSPLTQADPFLACFARRLGTREAMPFAEFMDLALYDPVCGYYRQDRDRVARRPGADFYTAESFREVFSALIAAATIDLLEGRDPSTFAFVEIGAEPDGGLLPEAMTGFREFRVVRLGEETDLPSRAIVFSNELYDAQPFHRVVRRGGRWIEAGVALREGSLVWSDLESVSRDLADRIDPLPTDAPEASIIDLPIAAASLLGTQVAGQWEGLLIAADYGKSWAALAEDYPEGTGRAYRNHRQERDLLATPGHQDLTCFICWDWMQAVLEQNRFSTIRVESQEAFFMRHAPGVIGNIIAGPGGPLTPRHSQLKTLLHPGLMGQKFQILHGRR